MLGNHTLFCELHLSNTNNILSLTCYSIKNILKGLDLLIQRSKKYDITAVGGGLLYLFKVYTLSELLLFQVFSSDIATNTLNDLFSVECDCILKCVMDGKGI